MKTRARQNARYAERDWLIKRRRDLRAQRSHVLSELARLEQEAVNSC